MGRENFMSNEGKDFVAPKPGEKKKPEEVSQESQEQKNKIKIDKEELFNEAIKNEINGWTVPGPKYSKDDRFTSEEFEVSESLQEVISTSNASAEVNWDKNEAEQDGDEERAKQLDKKSNDLTRLRMEAINKATQEHGYGSSMGGRVERSIYLEASRNPQENRGLQQDVLFSELHKIEKIKNELLKKESEKGYGSKNLEGDALLKAAIESQKKREKYINEVFDKYENDGSEEARKNRLSAEKNMKECQLQLAILDGSLKEFLLAKKVKDGALTEEQINVVNNVVEKDLEEKRKEKEKSSGGGIIGMGVDSLNRVK